MLLQGRDKIFGVNEQEFEELTLEIFRFQYANNPVYAAYVNSLGKSPLQITHINEIPFLPVRFFKTHEIKTTEFSPELVFESSGTTGNINSHHLVKDASLYRESFNKAFQNFYGNISEWCILGLLPSYLERKNSSLVYMVEHLIVQSECEESGFYLDEFEKLANTLRQLESRGCKTLLIGVTFALLDFAERFPMPLHHTVIMETGGMKGRKEEMIREEVHQILKSVFQLPAIHSEYGMTELLSQAYSKGEGRFYTPAWMKVLVRDEEDPFLVKANGSGIINIIDLANLYSCSFIATDDAGRLNADGSFEVLGRVDGSDLRGCSLLTT